MSLPLEVLCSGIESWVGLVLLLSGTSVSPPAWTSFWIDSLLISGTGNIFSGVSWQVGVGTFIRCFRFLRNTRPPLSTMYDLRLWSLLMTLDSVVHCFSIQLDSYPVPWLEWRELSCAIPSVKRLLIAPFCFNICFLDCCMVCKLSLWEFDHFWDGSSYLSSHDQLYRCLSCSWDRGCTIGHKSKEQILLF